MMLKFLLLVCMLMSALSAVASPPAPPTLLSVDTLGPQFQVSGKASVNYLPDGLSVKGDSFAQVTLLGVLHLPSSELAERRVSRLTVHFKTSHNGPTLRKIILLNGRAINLSLSGDFLADSNRNTIEFGDTPLEVFGDTTIRLVVSFPGGIDSQINPGEFFFKGITVSYLKKPEALAKDFATEIRSK